MEDGRRHAPLNRDVARELGDHRRRPVDLRTPLRRQPLRHLPLHHRHDQPRAGELEHRPEDDRGGDAVREVGHHLRRRWAQASEVDSHRVLEVECRVVERLECVAQRRLERGVDLHDVDVADASGQVLGQNAEPAADLEHDVVFTELGGAADHAQDVVVDQEVLAELAVRPHTEVAEPPQAGLAGSAHHRKTRAAVASTARSSSS